MTNKVVYFIIYGKLNKYVERLCNMHNCFNNFSSFSKNSEKRLTKRLATSFTFSLSYFCFSLFFFACNFTQHAVEHFRIRCPDFIIDLLMSLLMCWLNGGAKLTTTGVNAFFLHSLACMLYWACIIDDVKFCSIDSRHPSFAYRKKKLLLLF